MFIIQKKQLTISLMVQSILLAKVLMLIAKSCGICWMPSVYPHFHYEGPLVKPCVQHFYNYINLLAGAIFSHISHSEFSLQFETSM